MEFLTTSEIAEKWKITRRRVSKLCSESRELYLRAIPG
jgi:plasmid maintenance system antidote protein VapI